MAIFTTGLAAAIGAATGLGTAAAGVAAYGAVAGVVGTVKAGNAAKKSARLQQRSQELQQKRQRRAAIRSNMIASSRARASAQASGVAQSSGLQGAVGSGRSQLGSELGFGTQMSGLSGQITELGIKQQRYEQIASLGFSAMNFGMSQQGQNMFGPVDRTLPAGVSPSSSLRPQARPF